MSAPEPVPWSEDVKKTIATCLGKLDDLRQMYPNRPGMIVQHLVWAQPTMYDANIVQAMLKGISDDKATEDMRTIDMCLVIFRYLHAYLNQAQLRYPHESEDPELQKLAKDKEDCILLHLVFKDLRPDDDVDVEPPQSVLRHFAAKQVAQSLGLQSTDKLEFKAVMESRFMHKYIFSRLPFLLRHPIGYERWRDSPDPIWHAWETDDEGKILLAGHSLVEWDGVADLKAIFHWKFGIVQTEEYQGLWVTNKMGFVHMHYKPTPGHRQTFDDIKLLEFDTLGMTTTGPVYGVKKIVIAAIVQFNRKNGRPDVLCIYFFDQRQCHITQDVDYLEDDEWRMGDEDEGEYMLYYHGAPPLRRLLEPTAEVVPRPGPTAAFHASHQNIGVPQVREDGNSNQTGGARVGRGGTGGRVGAPGQNSGEMESQIEVQGNVEDDSMTADSGTVTSGSDIGEFENL
ncbi:hypothetical protein PG997_015203 [Apiospora hydei]|uniref:Uncharacterized protein n=1 Tax=Apiospora hydei TaxID=1337664 RepID=A0ABR1UVY8_9PEZI